MTEMTFQTTHSICEQRVHLKRKGKVEENMSQKDGNLVGK